MFVGGLDDVSFKLMLNSVLKRLDEVGETEIAEVSDETAIN